MRKSKQLSLFKDPRKNTKLWWIKKQKVYGGSMDYRKVERPFDSKMLIHAVFKGRVTGVLQFTKFEADIRRIISETAARYGIKVTDVAVNHDHIHILFYTKLKEAQTRFLRLFSAEMGRKYKALRKHFGFGKRPLWIQRPFSRLVSWGKKSLMRVKDYIKKNRREAVGFLDYAPRKHKISEFLTKWNIQPGWNSR